MVNVVLLASFLENKLNENTQGLNFRTYTFEKTIDRRYDDDSGNFIPSIITTPMGSYLPSNQTRGARMTFNLEVLLPLSDKYSWIDMLNDFIWSLNGNVFFIKDDTITAERPSAEPYTTIKMACQVPSFGSVNAQNMEVLNHVSTYLPIKRTENYVGINVPISIKTIDGIMVGDEKKISIMKSISDTWTTGNETGFANAKKSLIYSGKTFNTQTEFNDWIKQIMSEGDSYDYAKGTGVGEIVYYAKSNIKYLPLKVIEFSIKNTKMPTTEHLYGDFTAQTFIKENVVHYITTIYLENQGESAALISEIVENITTGANQNQEYFLKIEYPIKKNGVNMTFFLRVVVPEQALIMPIDDFSSIPLTFTRSWRD